MATLTHEEVFRLLKNRGIEIEDKGNAYDTLQDWKDKLPDKYLHAATFYAEDRTHLTYVSGSKNTKIYIQWCPDDVTVVDNSPDEDHSIELDVEIEAAKEGRPFNRWEYIKAKRKMLRELLT